jgi:superfamily II DNA or RNA helicase
VIETATRDADARRLDAVGARRGLAERWLADDDVPPTLGAITLLAHQRDAAARLRALLREASGALLADEVGLGKTYTALAAVAPYEPLVVVAPASLLAMWRGALAAVGRRATCCSFERLSARAPLPASHRCAALIVDEAHHARTPTTRRHARLAALAAGARVRLLSATPIHNRTRDLRALLALFLGESAALASERDLLRLVIRRTHDGDGRSSRSLVPPLPRIAPVRAIHLAHDDAGARALLAIPPPVRARDGAPAAALTTLSLVHAWSSSHAALRHTLRRRLARAEALRHALDAGRHPTREELRAWVIDAGAVQLAFPELASDSFSDPSDASIVDALRAHAAGVRTALDVLARARDADIERGERLRELRAAHPRERILAFAQYEATIDAMYARLSHDGGLARLSARGARVAGGTLSRVEALRRFAPRAFGASEPRAAERIVMLLATDLLSEGVSLHDASVVVHLDLPWTPARLEQRVGRVRRIGSPHDIVHVYAMRPPALGDRILRVLERLDRKARDASLVARIAPLLPLDAWTSRDEARRPSRVSVPPAGSRTSPIDASPIDASPIDASPLAAVEWCRERLRAWRLSDPAASSDAARDGRACGDDLRPIVAALGSPIAGWLALVHDGEERRLLASLDRAEPDASSPVVARAIALADEGADAPLRDEAYRAAMHAATAWLDRVAGARLALGARPSGPAVRRFLASLDALVARAPTHRRAEVAALASRARAIARSARGLAAERALATMIVGHPTDDVLIDRLTGACAEHAARANVDARRELDRPPARIIALLLLTTADSSAETRARDQ